MSVAVAAALLFAAPFAILADFWKELDKVVDVLDELAAPTVSNVIICEDVSEGRPVGVSTSFPRNTRKLHVWFNVSGAGPEVSISSVWAKENGGQYSRIQELVKNGPADKGRAWMDFSLAVPDGSIWPPGSYKVDIVWNQKVLGTAQFSISDAVKGGEGIWMGDGAGPAAVPNTPSSTGVPVAPALQGSPDVSILTDDEKHMVRNLGEQEIVMMVGSKIHGLETDYSAGKYKHGNDPRKMAELRSVAQDRISKVKRWGNAALAIKNLPPRWNPDEPHQLDVQSGGAGQRKIPDKKPQNEEVDFSF